jgi:hypothetical protein
MKHLYFFLNGLSVIGRGLTFLFGGILYSVTVIGFAYLGVSLATHGLYYWLATYIAVILLVLGYLIGKALES